MAYATIPGRLDLSAGVFIGFGLAGCSFTSCSRRSASSCRRSWRPLAFGVGTAAGSFGQFLFSPLAVSLMDNVRLADHARDLRRRHAAGAAAVARARDAAGDGQCRRGRAAIAQAGARARPSGIAPTCCWCWASSPAASSSPSSPCTCRPIWSIAASRRRVGGWTIGVIGLFNIVGSLSSGWLARRHAQALPAVGHLFRPRRRGARLHLFPVTPRARSLFGAVMGLLWLSTVPPTTASWR